MKTDWSCLSNRLERMIRAYRRIADAAIFALCGMVATAAPGMAGTNANLLCVLVPHFKDEYWLSVAHGLEQRASERGLAVRFFEAGGYNNALANQIDQLDACAALDPSAILIGAVSADAPELLAALEKASRSHPVIGLVNEVHSDELSARVGVDWRDMGLALGRHLAARFPAGGAPQRAIYLTGPTESGWVAPLEEGLRHGLDGSSVSIVATYGADTGTAEQLRLLEAAWNAHPDATLVIGTAPAIEVAMAFFAGRADRPLLAATYLSHSVARGLVGGQVLAAPFDDPVRQGILAVDAAANPASGGPVAARIPIDIATFTEGTAPEEMRLSPADYFPKVD